MKILVVDDEELARDRLRRLVNDIDGCAVCGEASNGRAALEQAESLHPDLLLLDIRMPGIDGLETARHLSGFDTPPAVIFTTAYGDHALAAFETQAVDYLLKPIRRERLESAIARAHRLTRAQLAGLADEQVASARTHLCVHQRGTVELVPIDEIRYFRAEHKYVTVRLANRSLLIEESLKSLEQEFGDRFARIHRNTLVARGTITALEKGSDGQSLVRLKDVGESLEVSRRHLSELRRRLKR